MRLMQSMLKWIGIGGFLLPVAFAATVLTFPFWRWIEETFYIESVGHSGPASWCFYTVYALCLSSTITALLVLRNRRRPSPNKPI